MSLKIRLAKVGKHGQKTFRIVVGETRSKRDGKNLGILGYYNPNTHPAEIKIDKNLYEHWFSLGARPSPAVKKILITQDEKTS
jgi:small subunit ribosomal protein S16